MDRKYSLNCFIHGNSETHLQGIKDCKKLNPNNQSMASTMSMLAVIYLLHSWVTGSVVFEVNQRR